MIPQRLERLNGVLRGALAEILVREVSDKRLEGVVITEVRLSPDGKTANVLWTVHGRTNRRRDAKNGLKAATPFLRKMLGKRAYLKRLPALRFDYDDRYDSAERVSRLLEQDDHPSGGENSEEKP